MFLKRAIFFPRYFISIGTVTKPTVVNVEIKTAICMIPAPLFNSSEATGKAINAGIREIEPVSADITIPVRPDSAPM